MDTFNYKRKDKPVVVQKQEKQERTGELKQYIVDVQEGSKVVLVLKAQDVVTIYQDEQGQVYPEQFRELYNKHILKDITVNKE